MSQGTQGELTGDLSVPLGLAHLISLLVTLWGAGLLAKAALDRTEYVRHPAAWSCR